MKMANIIINSKKREIVITKAFAKKAEKFQSDEYNELKNARLDNPRYKVVVKKSAKKDNLKGLDYNFMKNYIEKNDDENGSKMKEFVNMTEKQADALGVKPYGQVKKWFLEQYPVFLKTA